MPLNLEPPGSTTVTIGAGTAIIGKVGIDQTTPGTTNAVVATTNADAAIAAGTAPAKALVGALVYNSSEPSPTNGQSLALQADSKGRQRMVLMDAAGNTRGANVNASSQLSVSVDNAIALGASSAVIGQTIGAAVTVTVGVTRPNDTNAYAANDAWSSSTSAPAAITFSSVARTSGGSVLLTDLVVTSSANQTTLMQGELWLFDTAPAVINDNVAFTITDGEYNTVVAKIPFSIDSAGNATSGAGGNAGCFITGINSLVTGVASANLTALIKVINAYTPVANEALTFRLKGIQVT